MHIYARVSSRTMVGVSGSIYRRGRRGPVFAALGRVSRHVLMHSGSFYTLVAQHWQHTQAPAAQDTRTSFGAPGQVLDPFPTKLHKVNPSSNLCKCYWL